MPPSDGALRRAVAARGGGDDLLGEWGTNGNALAPRPDSGYRADDDLVGEWVPQTPAGAITVKPYVDSAPEPLADETPGERAARLAAQSGGWLEGKATRLGAGVIRGIGNVADTLAQGIAYAGEKGAGLAGHAGWIAPETHQGVIEWRKRINADIAREQEAFKKASAGSRAAAVGEFGGELLGTAPFLGVGGGLAGATLAPRIASNVLARGAGAGGAISALTSSTSDEPLISQLGKGAIIGGSAGPILGGVGKAAIGGIGDVADLARKAIDKYGIPLRADQLSSNQMVKNFGSLMQRIPFTGFGAHAAEQQNAFNRALAKEMGEASDKVTTEVVDNATNRVGDVFNSVARRAGDIEINSSFINKVRNTVSDAASVLGGDAIEPIKAQIKRIFDVVNLNKSGKASISADSYLALTRKDAPLDRLIKHQDSNMSYYALEVRKALDDMLEGSAPKDVIADLKNARYQYAIAKALDPLAVKAPTGDINPKLVLGAARGHRGNLLELGHIGQKLLAEPSSSNTAERLAILTALGGGTYAFDPEHFQQNALKLGEALAAGRIGGAALTSKYLTDALIKSSRLSAMAGRLNLPAISMSGATPGATALIGRNLLSQGFPPE
jgi:hypothetical protein